MSEDIYDVAIIGGGPCGIAAAIGIASEGPRTIVLDERPVGGQVATSSRIENVFGAPVGGISGQEMMSRGVDQATAFGTEIRTPFRAVRVLKDPETGIFTITAANRSQIMTRVVVLASGVSYRRLPGDGVDQFNGRGIVYGAPQYQVPEQWHGKKVGIIGGGNSAGQAALFLSQCQDCQVNVFVRGEGLETDMSHYLLKHVQEADNIVVHSRSTLERVVGTEKWMEGIDVQREGVSERHELNYLLIQIGAEPQTGWLDGTLALDARGYVLTDRDIPDGMWPESAGRSPFRYETSLPGMFAGGDIHSGSPNRMSYAVGEGHALAVSVYQYWARLKESINTPFSVSGGARAA